MTTATLPESSLASQPSRAPADAAAIAAPREHLLFLDGLRGLAALYVMLGHAYHVYWSEVTRVQQANYGFFIVFGAAKQAVALFIVLSGFCLMMPVARSADDQLRGGAGRYLKRRAWRILPPYYAALALSLLMIAVFPALQRTDGVFLSLALPVWRTDVILSHLLMVYNLHSTWIFKINPPFWSVATEWQIYFLFPLLLLPVWRKLGALATVVVALVVGMVPHFALGRTHWSISEAHPWFSGLFAMGMVAAAACFSSRRSPVLDLLKARAGSIAVIFTAATVALALGTDWYSKKFLPFDVLAGVAAAALLVWCQQRGGKGLMLGFLECRPVVFLGAISYSLYLMHTPLLFLVHRWSEPWHTSPAAVVTIMYAIGVPVVLAACYVFHLIFERPFMTTGPRAAAAPGK